MEENTPLEEIYELYAQRICSYDFLSSDNGGLTDEELNEDLEGKLKVALGRFDSIRDLEADFIMGEFNRKLTYMEKDILSLWMISEWVKPKLLTEEKLSDTLSSKDYQNHSPANMLDKLTNLKKEIDSEASRYTVKYGYKNKPKKEYKKWDS